MRLSNQDQHLGSMKQEKQGPYPRVLVIWERRLFDWVLSSWPWAYVHLGQVSLPLTVPLWLMPSIEAAGAGTVYIWKARPVFVQMLLILSHMRQELKAPRPRSWVTVALIGGERDNGQWSATFRANGRSCGFFKMTPTHNTFFPSLHNFFLHNVYATTSGELLGPLHRLEPQALAGLLLPCLLPYWLLRPCKEAHVNRPGQCSLWPPHVYWRYNLIISMF